MCPIPGNPGKNFTRCAPSPEIPKIPEKTSQNASHPRKSRNSQHAVGLESEDGRYAETGRKTVNQDVQNWASSPLAFRCGPALLPETLRLTNPIFCMLLVVTLSSSSAASRSLNAIIWTPWTNCATSFGLRRQEETCGLVWSALCGFASFQSSLASPELFHRL